MPPEVAESPRLRSTATHRCRYKGFARSGGLSLTGLSAPGYEGPHVCCSAEGSSGEENCLSRFTLQFRLSLDLELCLLFQVKPVGSSRHRSWKCRQRLYLLPFHPYQSLRGGI